MNVFDAIAQDLKGRDELGARQHGGRELDPHDGRDWLQEAYEEALDLCVYLKAAIVKRDAGRNS